LQVLMLIEPYLQKVFRETCGSSTSQKVADMTR